MGPVERVGPGSGAAFTGKVYLDAGTYVYQIGGAGEGPTDLNFLQGKSGQSSIFKLADGTKYIEVTGGTSGGLTSNISYGKGGTVNWSGFTIEEETIINGNNGGTEEHNGPLGIVTNYLGVPGDSPLPDVYDGNRGKGGTRQNNGYGGYIELTYSTRDNEN